MRGYRQETLGFFFPETRIPKPDSRSVPSRGTRNDSGLPRPGEISLPRRPARGAQAGVRDTGGRRRPRVVGRREERRRTSSLLLPTACGPWPTFRPACRGGAGSLPAGEERSRAEPGFRAAVYRQGEKRGQAPISNSEIGASPLFSSRLPPTVYGPRPTLSPRSPAARG